MYTYYLFQRDKFYDLKYDTCDKVIQCGRHNNVFKFWLQWRAKVNISYSAPQTLIDSDDRAVFDMGWAHTLTTSWP